jgi:hypothetical protein
MAPVGLAAGRRHLADQHERGHPAADQHHAEPLDEDRPAAGPGGRERHREQQLGDEKRLDQGDRALVESGRLDHETEQVGEPAGEPEGVPYEPVDEAEKRSKN